MKSRNLICLVSDRRRLSPDADLVVSLDRLVQLVAAAARAGVDLVQLRERDLEARELARLTEQCLALTAGTPCKVLVNDRTDVALGTGAHGVHLRADSIDAAVVRCAVPQAFLVGRSVHGAAEAAAVARRGGVDYLIMGTLFPSASKSPARSLTGLEEVARACRAVPVPVLAIGGITPERVDEIVKSGAAGLAGIGLFIPQPGIPFDRHLERCVGSVQRVFDTCGVVS
jgi:thiamine-phosphate diphosphorylase